MELSIYTNREITIKVAKFINDNRLQCYIGKKGNNSYYNVNGIVWEVWQDGCGNYPTSNNIRIEDFKL